jgi:Tol biopolymer transport system component
MIQAFPQTHIEGVLTGFAAIGKHKFPGSVDYNALAQGYTIKGAGKNMWFGTDDFNFLYKKLQGDFILTARLKFVGPGVDPHRKAGWMVRHSLETNTIYADAAVHGGDGLTSLQYRDSIDGMTKEVAMKGMAADILRLERTGNILIFTAARFGEPLKEVGRLELNIGKEVYAGLFVCSHNEDVVEEVQFTNVRIEIPAPANFVPYKSVFGSRMEILDIASGNRKVIYESPEIFEAPNWSPDGKSLIYNSKGLLYKIPVNGGTPELINTGVANALNNDHGISFDGKWIAMSHHSKDLEPGKNSLIYVVPINGGEARQVTKTGPSYWHGWSPDGKWLAYVGGRNNSNNYDIYKIPAKGGKEIRLTTADCLDDGPEYSPDGKYIYFNSCRSGKMQIWRMKPDGSSQERVTNGEFNDWFPHISPDGKKMVFISFGDDVAPGDHPPCKRVLLRMLDLEKGGEPVVVAYLYGGQGTINVPSWSPDSKQVAFVSYSF